jgi:menaquinone-dependent protoporphyrinogen oxidase
MNSPKQRPRVLVSVASRHQSTTEIARVIRDTLTGHRMDVDIVPPAIVDSIDDYDAVLLGSAVYADHWLAPARDFAIRFARPLAARPVWLFSSGPVGALSSEKDPAEVTRIQQAIPVRGHRMFDGKIDPRALSAVERASLLTLRGVRGDFRDWDAVAHWADSVAASLEAMPLR